MPLTDANERSSPLMNTYILVPHVPAVVSAGATPQTLEWYSPDTNWQYECLTDALIDLSESLKPGDTITLKKVQS